MHLHILGIGGTFMAGLARIAVACGHRVTGSDEALYPPMSTQLEALGVEVAAGYGADALKPPPDLVIVGNAISRGNPAVEYMLSARLSYTSGPEWLKHNVLSGKRVVAIAGTHGKTTVSSLLAWMLDHAGLEPGFLIGGVVENFGVSSRLGTGDLFVVEADEYDTAFFDKRSKFIHYLPTTLLINNLEFDHADIFEDLGAIKRQFHHLVRTMPREAQVLRPAPDADIDDVLAMGCYSTVTTFGVDSACAWQVEPPRGSGVVTVITPAGERLTASTPLPGEHNSLNTVAAVAAAATVGVGAGAALGSLASFRSVKRRLELRGEQRGVSVYDDFAHHPSAIAATIEALREQLHGGRLIAVLEPRSNTMRMGVHADTLGPALGGADFAAVFAPEDLEWDLGGALSTHRNCRVYASSDLLVDAVVNEARPGDAILVMSNGAFDNIHERLLDALRKSP